MTNFVFNFRPQYTELVERCLYNYERKNFNGPDHAFQCKPKGRMVCLLCKMSLSNCSPSVEDLNKHLESSIHLGSIDIQAFDSYHNIFMQLDEADQYLQVYFRPMNYKSVLCETCMEEVPEENIVGHANSNFHFQHLNEYWLHTEVIHSSPKLEEVSLDYSRLTQFDILPHRLQRLAYINSPLIVQKVGKSIYCILCHKKIESFKEHYETKKHTSSAQRTVPFQSLWHFHNYWINQSVQDQYKRRYFLPVGFQEVRCIVCQAQVKYRKILSHTLRCNSLEKMDSLCEPELKRFVVVDTKMNYSNDIKLMFYPSDLTARIRVLENLNMYTIQRLLGNTQCLLCQVFLEGVMMIFEVLDHVKSQAHQSKLKKTHYTEPLVAYHEFWMKQDINFQVLQQFFRPCLEDIQHCWKCQQKCKCDEIVEHAKICQSNSLTYSRTSTNSSRSSGRSSTDNLIQIGKDAKCFVQENNFRGCTLEHVELKSGIEPQTVIPNSSINLKETLIGLKSGDVSEEGSDCSTNVIDNPRVFKVSEDIGEIKNDSSINANKNRIKFKAGDGVNQINNSSFISVLGGLTEFKTNAGPSKINDILECRVSDSVTQVHNPSGDIKQEIKSETSVEMNKYDNNIMNALYPHHNNKKKYQPLPTKYYLQKRSRFECYCLYCNTSIIELVTKHAEGKKHRKNSNNPLIQKQLESYHKFWLAQPSDKQHLQVYFNPHIMDLFLCVICNKPVFPQNVINHPCLSLNNMYERFAVVEQYRHFEMKYHEIIARRYFSRGFLEVTKIILNTEIPVAVHLDGKAVCFICGNKILRELKYWYKHLLDHCSNKEYIYMKLPCILEYHKFWEQQNCYWQACMIHYAPVRSGHMKCAKKHLVPYDKVFEHTEICPIEESYKFVKMCKDFTPESANMQQNQLIMKSQPAMEQLNSGDESSESSNRSCTPGTSDNLDSSIIEENCDSDSEYSENATATDNPLVEKVEVKLRNSEGNLAILNPAERALMMEISKLEKGTINWAEAGNLQDSGTRGFKLPYEYPYVPGTSKEMDVPETKEYDNETICTLYPNFNNINRSRRPTTYFLQKRSNFERYCLICCTPIFGIPVEHVRSKKHIKNSNGYPQKLLEAYHDFWMGQPPDIQLLQINFNPYTLNSFYCLVCKKQVAIKNVINHPCLKIQNKYENFEVPEDYREFELKYSDPVRMKFFSKSFLEVSKTVLNTKIPIFLHFQGKVSCFLCGKRIYRDLGFWQKHLLDHCSKLDQIHIRLPYILQYHQFWEQQIPDLQICMVHYVPDCKGALKCAKQHVVLYNEALKHSKVCPIESWDKLVKLCNKDVPLESELERLKKEGLDNSESDDDIIFSESTNDTGIDGLVEKEDVNESPKVEKKKAVHAILTPAERALMEEINKSGKNQKKQHNLIPSVDNNQSDHVFDSIPNRFKFEILNLGERNKLIYCKLCNINCGTTVSEILSHLITAKHAAHIKKFQKREYYCEVCRQKFKNEMKWLSHIGSVYHKLLCDKYRKSNDTVLQEYECLTCLCILFGDEHCASIHKEQRKIKKKKPITLKREVLELFSDADSTEKMALTLHKDILQEEQKDEQLVKACLRGFEDALKIIYPDCVAYPFGSRVTGIGNSKSDLDVFIDIGNMYFDITNQKIQQDIVLRVKKILSENRKKFSDICAITNARTPIIRVVHTMTNIDCDLSFRHGLSVENTKFISFCFDLQPVTRLAMLILKRWADIINLKDEITSYALCMMFIFYMQVDGLLISVQRLRELTTTDVPTIDDWEVIDYTKSAPELMQHVKTYDGSVFALLQGFFKMYSEFEFEKLVVCPLLGRTVLVENFKNKGDTLPPEMAKFSLRLKSDLECEFKVSSMCVQDPFDLAHNLTKAVFKSYRDKYEMMCHLTYTHMSSVS